MKIGSPHTPSFIWHRTGASLTQTGLLFLVVCLASGVFFVWETLAQAAGPVKKPSAETSQESPVESYAPIGESGYRVPIHEFRMKRIIGGDRPGTQKPPAEHKPESTTSQQPPPAEPEAPAVSETGPQKRWLPFDPERRRPSSVPLPRPSPKERVTPKTDEGPPIRPPAAPEEPLEAIPPKKEMLPLHAAPPLPGLTTGARVKETLKGLPLETVESTDSSAELDGIPIETRKEPLAAPAPIEPEAESPPTPAPPQREQIPPLEPQPTRESKPAPKPEPVPEPMTVPEPRPTPSEAVPGPKPESTQQAVPMQAPEQEPAPAELPRTETIREPVREPVIRPEASPEPAPREAAPPQQLEHEELLPPKETIPSPEQPRLPMKEDLPSPLDQEALHSPEVRSYLREAAPLLEELSLLMTRAPSLTVEDYDPSSGAPTAFAEDLSAKIEHMKRELQVLDSKTFAIIPPIKYSGFHSVIRESITQTYQACDTIAEYLRQPSERNLRKLQDHLRKARDLIQRTRTGRI